jgi:hypothetical protein
MSDKVNLRLDWCSYEAAKYAVEHWHYSGNLPAFGRRINIGVWENADFIGAIIYAYSATPNIAKHYKLPQTEIIELRRVAMKEHRSATSRAVAFSIKMVKKLCPGIRLLVSFADVDQKHLGVIYQATNWIYTGMSMQNVSDGWIVNNKFIHRRTMGTSGKGRNNLTWIHKHLDPNATEHFSDGKHCYLFPLDDAMRKQIEPLRKPYPKRERGETDNAPQSNAETEGASPIRSLLQESTE